MTTGTQKDTTMKTKQYLYAAVGAPVVVAKAAQTRLDGFKVKVTEGRESLAEDIRKQLENWAAEGEQFVGKLGETKPIDEITERVDLEQVQEQVSKLRDQLEDLLDTWRTNFRPAGKAERISERIQVEVSDSAAETVPAGESAAKATAAAEKPAAKKPAAKKPAAKTTTAAKKPAAKKPAAKKPAAEKPADEAGAKAS